MQYDIYFAEDTCGIGYVGQSKRGAKRRWRQHEHGAHSRVKAGRLGRYTPEMKPDLRRHWEDHLMAEGRFDEIQMRPIAHAATPKDADAVEQERIAHYLAQGYVLVNTKHNPHGAALDRQLKEAWDAGRHDPTRCPYLQQRAARESGKKP